MRPFVAAVLLVLNLVLSVQAVRNYGARVLIARTTAAMNQRQFSVAAESAAAAVRLNPHSGPARFFLGQNLLALGQVRPALESLLIASPIFAHRPSTLRLLGQAYLQLSEFDASAESFAWSLRLAPTPPAEPVVRRQMSLSLYRAARFGESLHAQFLAMRTDAAAEADLQSMRIHCAALSGLPELCITAIRSGLAASTPRQPSAEQLKELVLLAGQTNRLEQVERALDLAVRTTAMDRVRIVSAHAAVLARMGRREAAVAALEALLAVHRPDDPEPYLLQLQLMAGDGAKVPRLDGYGLALKRFAGKFPMHPELGLWRERANK